MSIRVAKCSLLFVATLVLLATLARTAESSTQAANQPADTPKKFIVFANFNTQSQDLTKLGLSYCTIVSLGSKEAKAQGEHDESKIKDLVHAAANTPGPLVYDLEYVYDFKLFLNLVQWTHEAVPGSVVGFYGHGLFPDPPKKEQRAQAAELAKAVDAFFPSMYTFDDNTKKWKSKMVELVQQAHRIAPGKPVYPYIWPNYHKGAVKTGLLSGDHWKFELQAAQECGADGVVIWGGKSFINNPPWWQETLKFVAGNPKVEQPKTPDGKNGQNPLDGRKKYGD